MIQLPIEIWERILRILNLKMRRERFKKNIKIIEMLLDYPEHESDIYFLKAAPDQHVWTFDDRWLCYTHWKYDELQDWQMDWDTFTVRITHNCLCDVADSDVWECEYVNNV